MNIDTIVRGAIATVGLTQLLKNLINKGGKKTWTAATIGIGIAVTALQSFCPLWAMDGIIIISGATIFYDTIYQTFERMFKGNGERKEEEGER